MRDKRGRRWLAAGGILLLTTLGVLVFAWRKAVQNPQTLLKAIPEQAHITIGEVNHTAVRDGRKEWVLEAASASYIEKTRQAVFESAKVTFFRPNGGTIQIEGRNAQANTETNDIELAGEVAIHRAEYTLTTERLHYDHRQRRIVSQLPVQIRGPSVQLRSDHLEIDLGSETARLQGHVEGTFNVSQSMLP